MSSALLSSEFRGSRAVFEISSCCPELSPLFVEWRLSLHQQQSKHPLCCQLQSLLTVDSSGVGSLLLRPLPAWRVALTLPRTILVMTC